MRDEKYFLNVAKELRESGVRSVELVDGRKTKFEDDESSYPLGNLILTDSGGLILQDTNKRNAEEYYKKLLEALERVPFIDKVEASQNQNIITKNKVQKMNTIIQTLANWRTTFVGAGAVIAGIILIIDGKLVEGVTAILAGLGFALSKDAVK